VNGCTRSMRFVFGSIRHNGDRAGIFWCAPYIRVHYGTKDTYSSLRGGGELLHGRLIARAAVHYYYPPRRPLERKSRLSTVVWWVGCSICGLYVLTSRTRSRLLRVLSNVDFCPVSHDRNVPVIHHAHYQVAYQ
jgi:hypothetical protein